VLDQQCTHFHGAATHITAEKARSLFSLADWADNARALLEAMDDRLKPRKRAGSTQDFRYEFALSIAVVRHLQLDPLLPVDLIGDSWPGYTLRTTYRRFDTAFKRRMTSVFRRT
jgi:phenylacetic acid degradation operon negative regulatory protein